jgi:hypothetical protein
MELSLFLSLAVCVFVQVCIYTATTASALTTVEEEA